MSSWRKAAPCQLLLISVFFSLQRVLICEVPQAHLDHLGHQVSISGTLGRWGITGHRGVKALRKEVRSCAQGCIGSVSSALPLPHFLLQGLPFQGPWAPKETEVRTVPWGVQEPACAQYTPLAARRVWMRLAELGVSLLSCRIPLGAQHPELGVGRHGGRKLYTEFLPLHQPGGRRGMRSPIPSAPVGPLNPNI